MKLERHNLVDLIFVIMSFAVPILLYRSLPDPVPSHWNLDGLADGFTVKPWGAFLLPISTTAVFLLLYTLPGISPRKFSITPFQRVYNILRTATLGFLLILTVVLLLSASGVRVPLRGVLFAAMGLLIVLLGNYLGKVTRNFFVGIRTPWTLASQEVWLRTHRVAGKLVVVAGLIFMAGSLVGLSEFWSVAILLLAVIIPAFYSFVLYRQLEGFKEGSDTEEKTEP